jgi:hypothetical protein
MPKDETTPIGDEELLLRRIPPDAWNDGYCDLVSDLAFRPRTKGDNVDKDGISLFRLDCLNTPAQLLERIADELKRAKYGIAGVYVVSVKRVRSLCLSVRIKPEPAGEGRLPGHVVIPEINATSYLKSTEKPAIKKAMSELAELASKKMIIPAGQLD